ncbi:MAG: asparagine synthase C-terminal domain-containing protein [Candidatus Pacebacteria bacterium]|nr:asparagine synthase C-terminal domain-containing protein [Candidatus Paceibacterota bacterium]
MLVNFKKLQKPKSLFYDENIKYRLFEVLDDSVKKLVKGYQEIPVAFSGGIDSSVLTYLVSKYNRPVLFCFGFKNSYDVKNAKKNAGLLNLKLNIIYFDELDLKKYLKKTIDILETKNRMVLDLNTPFVILSEELQKRNYTNIILGQGADELFAGYNRYKKTNNLEEDLFQDIKNIAETNLKYNEQVFNYFGVNIVCPFLEKEVVELAIKISPELKIKNSINKYILREAFKNYLPEEILTQNKKALQYGSGIHKAIAKFDKSALI